MMADFQNEIEKFSEILNFTNECVTFFGSARFEEDNPYCQMAYDLAKRLNGANFAILSGGGAGIMQAANKGAFEAANAPSVGLNVVLPFEQFTNKYATTSFVFSNLNVRKFALIHRSKAFVVFPGGFGTLDELFEILVLAQIGTKKSKIFLVGTQFWAGLDSFIKSTLLEQKAISQSDLQLYEISDDLDKITKSILEI